MANPLPVLIVGAGPTGLSLGIEMARHGVPFRLIDKSPQPAQWSQALVVQARTLEQFERYGIADRAVARGRRLSHAELLSDGNTIVSFPFSRIPGRYPFVLFLPQNETEQLLTEHLISLGGRIERGVELVSFEQGPPVRATVKLAADGRTDASDYSFIVGCDGAHSAVRHGLNVPFEGDTVGLSFLLGDLELTGPNVPGDGLRIHLHRGGDIVFFGRLSQTVWRVILVEHGRDFARTTPQLADFQNAIDRVVGQGIHVVRSHWTSPYHVNQRKAEHYRVGGAFLAGDACHIHSPVAGQGMNTGIQDAANLGWKLAAVINRHAPDALLDTYETERGQVGDDLLKRTSRGLALATAANPVVEFLRDAFAKVATSIPHVQDLLVGFISETAIHYPASSIVVDEHSQPAGPLRAGHRCPNPDVPGGGRLLDPLKDGGHLAILSVAGNPRAEADGLAVPTRALSVDDRSIRDLFGPPGQLFLVRPDGYIGYRGPASNSAGLSDYCRTVGVPMA